MTTGNDHTGGGGAGSALTGAALLFVLLRLLAVSHYDWHTAFALLHTLDLEDAPGLFLGTFMADSRISSALLVLMVPLTVFYAVGTRSRAAPLATAVLVAFLVAHVLTYHRWWVPVGAVVLTVLVVVVERLRRRPGLTGVVTFVLRRFGYVVGAVALVVAALVATPWVPLERIGTDEPFEGYVMETSPGFLKVLGAQEREFRILRAEDVRSRTELADH
ncbi:hypothetical protein ACFFSW_08365 [Saccharothrix longispora]|uniref:Lysylphosphatidylglycerol synthetase-like protein (DUF2156 family) n=1 Tax=Saccharothrix longispora TaxID=33920 RepID=A0ABU1Q6X9_9PSEU|nr:hypothetical protein [Saccharothrix longispora]MDR6598652.1 lysylphosphatidylglycerol synthetase-like protein (DUF2156 family) [Saccharothrix longispora]